MFEGDIVYQADDQNLLDEIGGVEIKNADIEQAVGYLKTAIRQAAKMICNPPHPVVRTNMEATFKSALTLLTITPEQYDAAVASKISATKLLERTEKFQDALRVARGEQRHIQWRRPERRGGRGRSEKG